MAQRGRQHLALVHSAAPPGYIQGVPVFIGIGKLLAEQGFMFLCR